MAAVAVERMNVDNRYASGNTSEEDKHPVDKVASSSVHNNNAVVFSPELLQMYYSRLFPFSMLHKWLSYDGKNNSHTFSRREFSFTIEPVPGEEIYLRYQSFTSQNELSQAVLKRRPVKIDIGAVFSHPPKDHGTIQSGKFKPVQRELVFDIDLTDYDDIRRCGCSGAKICGVCWKFMNMAVAVIDESLRKDFGFQHIAWFYSGRRGVHAWVCDESARDLTDVGRSAVASYLEVNLATDKNKDVSLPHPIHPMLERAFEVLEPMFIEQVVPETGHGLLASEEQWNGLLRSLPEAASEVRENLTAKWSQKPSELSPVEKWHSLKDHLRVFRKNTAKSGSGSKAAKQWPTKERNRLETWQYEVVFRYTYPRLDVNVSKMRNHLLKSPFCIHPKTGRVCVPVQPGKMDSFDPFDVPTLPQLMKELDEYEGKGDADNGGSNSNVANWQKTSLKGYFEPFQKEFLEPLMKDIRRQERDAAERQAALVGDF